MSDDAHRVQGIGDSMRWVTIKETCLTKCDIMGYDKFICVKEKKKGPMVVWLWWILGIDFLS